MKIVSIDIETTGLSVMETDIIEFGAILDDLSDRKPINSLPSFHCYFTKDRYVGEPFALSMHSKIFERIALKGEEINRRNYHYYNAEKFGSAFKQFLLSHGYETERDRVTINAAGKNFAAFDLQFLRYKTDFEKHIQVRSRIFDPGILYLRADDEAIPGMLECKRRAGITGEIQHNAIDDAKDVVALLRYKL